MNSTMSILRTRTAFHYKCQRQIHLARKVRYMPGYSYTMSASTAFQKSVTKMLVKSADVSSTTSTYTSKWCKSENKTGTILPYNLWFFQYGSFWYKQDSWWCPPDNTRSPFPCFGPCVGTKTQKVPGNGAGAGPAGPAGPAPRTARRARATAGAKRRYLWVCQGKWFFRIVIKMISKVVSSDLYISYCHNIVILIAIS